MMAIPKKIEESLKKHFENNQDFVNITQTTAILSCFDQIVIENKRTFLVINRDYLMDLYSCEIVNRNYELVEEVSPDLYQKIQILVDRICQISNDPTGYLGFLITSRMASNDCNVTDAAFRLSAYFDVLILNNGMLQEPSELRTSLSPRDKIFVTSEDQILYFNPACNRFFNLLADDTMKYISQIEIDQFVFTDPSEQFNFKFKILNILQNI